MNIDWYPGHMKKTKKLLKRQLKLVDMVYELLDARIPLSSKNPDLDKIMEDKPKIIILNKIDLADSRVTSAWVEHFKRRQVTAIPVNAVTGNGIKQAIEEGRKATKIKMDTLAEKGRRPRSIRIMVAGIPNVGKSSFINRLAGKRATRTGDKPGITRGKQWIRLKGNMDLLDTPGILWPKIENPAVVLNLAFTGAIKDGIIDIETSAYKLLEILWTDYKEKIIKRYKTEDRYDTIIELMDCIAKNRGCILSGNRIDYFRISNIILDEFRSAKIGSISLEYP